MPRYGPVMIACPERRKLVRGQCECDENGQYPTGPAGGLTLAKVRCGQDGGRCTQTLCALHRHNRPGPGTWYPSEVRIPPRQVKTRPLTPRRKRRPRSHQNLY